MTARTSMMSPINAYASTKYVPSTSARRRTTGTGLGSTYSTSSYNNYSTTTTRPPAYPASSRTSSYNTDTYSSRYSTTTKKPTSLRTVTSPRPLPPGRGPLDEHGRKMSYNDILHGRSTVSNRLSTSKNYGTTTYTTTHALGSTSREGSAHRSRFTRAGSVSDLTASFENMNTNSNHTSSLGRSKRFGSHADLSSSSTNSTPRTSSITPERSRFSHAYDKAHQSTPDRSTREREDHLYDTGGVNKHVSKNYYNTSSRTYDYDKHKENGTDSLPDIQRKHVGQSSRSITRSPSVDRGRRDESPLHSNRRSSITTSMTSRQNSINSMSSPQHSTISRSSPETSSASNMSSRGLVGLRNVGNTCFMNSIVQCLSNTRLLLEYCQNDDYKDDINKTTSNMKGHLVNAYAKLLKTLWKSGGDTYVSPTEFKSQIQKFAPRFVGYNQQDSQEFLIYLLEGLHEDVNRVKEKKKHVIKEEEGEEKISDDAKHLEQRPRSEMEQLLLDVKAVLTSYCEGCRGDSALTPRSTVSLPSDSASEKARETWKRYLSRENSRIVDIFVGQLKSCLKCTTCGYASNTFDPLWQLSLPIKKRGISDVSLQDCLDLFTNEEILDGDEKPTCARCKQRRKCTKSFSIQKFPKVLVIHLKRFNHESLFRSKLSTNVDFPLTDLDLTPYAAEKGSSPVLYNLYAVSNHSGTPLSGHYTAYAKHPYSGEWHVFNDQRVSCISSSRVKSSEGYVLFYELSNQSARL